MQYDGAAFQSEVRAVGGAVGWRAETQRGHERAVAETEKARRAMTDDKTNANEEILEGLTPERLERNQQAYADVVAKYYGDPDFKAKVDADPTAVLKAEGIDIPAGASVKLLFNTEKLLHIVLPSVKSGD